MARQKTNQEKHADDLLALLNEGVEAINPLLVNGILGIGTPAHHWVNKAHALLGRITKDNIKPYWYYICRDALKYLGHPYVNAIPFALPVSAIAKAMRKLIESIE